MESVNLLINIIIFIGISLLMSIVCISMADDKGDGRNTGSGYRTKRSMKSIECWNVGNRMFGYCTIPISIIEGIAIFIEDKILIPKNIIVNKHIIVINITNLLIGLL